VVGFAASTLSSRILFIVLRFADARKAEDAFMVDPLYLKHVHQDKNMDLRVY